MIFNTNKGKFGLLFVTLLLIGLVWYSNNLKVKSGNLPGSSATMHNVKYRVFTRINGNFGKVNVSFFIKNMDEIDRYIKFYRIYLTVVDKKLDKIVYKKEILGKAKLLIPAKQTEVFNYVLPLAKNNKEYLVTVSIIDENRNRKRIKTIITY